MINAAVINDPMAIGYVNIEIFKKLPEKERNCIINIVAESVPEHVLIHFLKESGELEGLGSIDI